MSLHTACRMEHSACSTSHAGCSISKQKEGQSGGGEEKGCWVGAVQDIRMQEAAW